MKKVLTVIKDHFLNIILPKTCHFCGTDLGAFYNLPLCGNCISKIKKPGPLVCRRCGISLPDGGAACYACRGTKGKKYKCSFIRSAFVFTPEIQKTVHNFKYSGHIYLADFMAENMIALLKETKEFRAADIIVPVPLHWFKRRIRGYNQSEVIAGKIASAVNIPCEAGILKRNKYTSAQVKLKKRQRVENVENAFICSKNLKGKKVLLIDDVTTTTSTLEACAVALKVRGAKKVYALTFAREE